MSDAARAVVNIAQIAANAALLAVLWVTDFGKKAGWRADIAFGASSALALFCLALKAVAS